MEFLKSLFGENEALTYDQLAQKLQAGKMNVVNIADGSYVSRNKHDDKVNTLTQQVTTLQGRIARHETDMTDLQNKLSAAQADAGKLMEAQNALTEMQTKYSTDQQEWAQKVQQQAYEFAVRERATGLKFSSAAARRDFIREANAKQFKMDGDTLMGYEDFLSKYKADNPGALVEETPQPPANNPPQIVLPNNQAQTPPEKSIFGFHFNGVRPKPEG